MKTASEFFDMAKVATDSRSDSLKRALQVSLMCAAYAELLVELDKQQHRIDELERRPRFEVIRGQA